MYDGKTLSVNSDLNGFLLLKAKKGADVLRLSYVVLSMRQRFPVLEYKT